MSCRPRTRRCARAPVRGDWWAVPGTVRAVFTHFRLEMLVYRAIVPADASMTFWADAAPLPVGAAPRAAIARPAQRHAQDHRAWSDEQ